MICSLVKLTSLCFALHLARKSFASAVAGPLGLKWTIPRGGRPFLCEEAKAAQGDTTETKVTVNGIWLMNGLKVIRLS